MDSPKKILVIIDLNKADLNYESEFRSLSNKLILKLQQDIEIDVLAFVDTSNDNITNSLKKVLPNSKINIIPTYNSFKQVEPSVIEGVNQLFSELRPRLIKIAKISVNSSWAKRFGELWWYTRLAEKNSPVDDIWWKLMYTEIIRRRISQYSYQYCLFIGSKSLDNLISQLFINSETKYKATIKEKEQLVIIKSVIWRIMGFFSLAFAIFCSRLINTKQYIYSDNKENKDLIFAYSWFPRVWVSRNDHYQDMYYGEGINELAKKKNKCPIFIMRLFDRSDYVSPMTYIKRCQRLQKTEILNHKFLLLESFGSILKTIYNYFFLGDLLRFLRMSRNKEFHESFKWNGINIYNSCSGLLWKSVIVFWPHLITLESFSKKLSSQYKPSKVLLYCFEFIYGKAIISGTLKANNKIEIIGLQHGPITPMKFMYNSLDENFIQKDQSEIPCPCPNKYLLDGEVSSEVLQNSGIKKENISVSGPVRFQDIWKLKSRKRSIRDTMNILVAPGLHDSEFVINFTIKALINKSNINMIIKPHPKININKIIKIIDASANVPDNCASVDLVKEGSIYSYLNKVDLFITTYSSTGVEAIAFDVPIIMLLSKKIPDMSLYFGKNDVALKAGNKIELVNHIDNLIVNKSFKDDYLQKLKQAFHRSFFIRGNSLDSFANNF